MSTRDLQDVLSTGNAAPHAIDYARLGRNVAYGNGGATGVGSRLREIRDTDSSDQNTVREFGPNISSVGTEIHRDTRAAVQSRCTRPSLRRTGDYRDAMEGGANRTSLQKCGLAPAWPHTFCRPQVPTAFLWLLSDWLHGSSKSDTELQGDGERHIKRECPHDGRVWFSPRSEMRVTRRRKGFVASVPTQGDDSACDCDGQGASSSLQRSLPWIAARTRGSSWRDSPTAGRPTEVAVPFR